MGNWIHGLFSLENALRRDATQPEKDAFRSGVEWGRREMLQQAVTLMRDEHDRVYTGSEACQLSGYGTADILIADWQDKTN